MKRWTRAVPWIGGIFIAAIVALAGYDIVDSYRTTVANTGRDLDAQARIIAEQSARSLQAVDVVLRHLVQQHRKGAFDAMSPIELHTYLRDQAVGLVQISGLVLVHPSGAPRALSEVYPVPASVQDISSLAIFRRLSAGEDKGLYIDDALQSRVDSLWIFPIARRLESPAGQFAGGVGARGRVDYFEQFYRDARLDPSTTISLMRENGTLIARHPHVESALGKRFAQFDEILALHNAGSHAPVRAKSPIDGVERFASLKLVPDYPLAVIVTRDAAAVLAPWRAQSIGTAVRTLALSALAALLLFIVTRQLSRLQRARESLEVEQERFGLAVTGSDDGIFDWDYRTGKAFGSVRAREILGLPAGPDVHTLDEWEAGLARQLHPEDLPRRLEAIRAHLAGEIPAYEGESGCATARAAGAGCASAACACARRARSRTAWPARSPTSTRAGAPRRGCARARSASRSPWPGRTTASWTGISPPTACTPRSGRWRSSTSTRRKPCAPAWSCARCSNTTPTIRRGCARTWTGCSKAARSCAMPNTASTSAAGATAGSAIATNACGTPMVVRSGSPGR